MKDRNFALIIAALSILGPFSVDTYFPSFPEIASHFGVTEIQVQSTLSFYLFALAVMSLFHGALSDSFGRRRIILVCMAIYSASAFACVAAPSFGWLLALRVMQGLTGGAGFIVSRAIIRDRFEGVTAQKFMAQVAVVSGLGPVIAPIIGGWLHVWFGWRGPFCFLGLLGTGLWCSVYFGLPESLSVSARHIFHPITLLRSYGEAVSHAAFVWLCLSMAFAGGGFLLYVATAPDVAINILGLGPTQFGWLFIPIVSGLILGSATSSKIAGQISSGRMIRYGFGLMIFGAAVNLLSNLVLPQRVPWAMLPLTFYTFGCSLIAPIFTIRCLDLIPHRKGLASSLQGFTQIVVFALISAVVPPFVYRSGIKHALGFAIFLALSGIAYSGFNNAIRPPRNPPHQP